MAGSLVTSGVPEIRDPNRRTVWQSGPTCFLLDMRLKWSNHKIGEVGETVSLCPEADLTRLRKSRILRFQHAPSVEGYLKNLACDL